MTISGFLPQRWRPSREAARHAEAIAGILHTPPIEPCAGGPAILSLIGTAEILPYLVAIKSLYRRMARGRIAVVDDGTLTGEDRAILAHHCGDPEIVPYQTVRRGPFPSGGEWSLLLTMLDGRAGQYWITLDPHSVTLADLPEVKAAIASNRSFALAGGAARGGAARQLERRMAVLCGTRGWRYRPSLGGLTGFAAGGTGRTLAAAFYAEAIALGESVPARIVLDVLLANESEPVLLPCQRYGSRPGEAAAFLHFPAGQRHDEAFAEASRQAVADLIA